MVQFNFDAMFYRDEIKNYQKINLGEVLRNPEKFCVRTPEETMKILNNCVDECNLSNDLDTKFFNSKYFYFNFEIVRRKRKLIISGSYNIHIDNCKHDNNCRNTCIITFPELISALIMNEHASHPIRFNIEETRNDYYEHKSFCSSWCEKCYSGTCENEKTMSTYCGDIYCETCWSRVENNLCNDVQCPNPFCDYRLVNFSSLLSCPYLDQIYTHFMNMDFNNINFYIQKNSYGYWENDMVGVLNPKAPMNMTDNPPIMLIIASLIRANSIRFNCEHVDKKMKLV